MMTSGRMILPLLVAGSALALAPQAEGQQLSGAAFGSYVKTPASTTQSPVAALPATGGYATGEALAFGVPGAVNATWLTAVTSGGADDVASSAQSSSELENVSVLNGLIQTANVTAIATTWRNASGTASSADGSGFVDLIVNGVAVATDVAPNTRVDLPGTGYAVLNEQKATADGLTVNMIHVFLQGLTGGFVNPLTGRRIGATLTTIGEIIVGSASAGVAQ